MNCDDIVWTPANKPFDEYLAENKEGKEDLESFSIMTYFSTKIPPL